MLLLGTGTLYIADSASAATTAGTFTTSVSSGRAGTLITLTSKDVCPAVPAGKEAQVFITITDAAGNVRGLRGAPPIKGGGATIAPAADGSWSTTMLIPYKTIDDYTSINYTDDAARGMAQIDAQCGYNNDTYPYGFTPTASYDSQPFNINGPSLPFNLSTRFAKQGDKIRISPANSCPAAATEGIIRIYNWTTDIVNQSFNVKNGNWNTVSVTIPSDAAGAIYGVEVECKVPNDKNSLYFTQQPIFVANNYLALGDSYSSGEGAPKPDYLAGTDLRNNRCHRSDGAYSQIVRKDLKIPYGTFRACSGAVINDFYQPNSSNAGEPAQLSWINDHTNLITLTIGGNDVGFADVMKYCALHTPLQRSCKDAYNTKVTAAIDHLASRDPNDPQTLQSLYTAIRDKATNAHVIVMGYPRLFPKNPPKDCGTGVPNLTFSRSDMVWMNKSADKLDQVIKDAAIDQGFTYIDVNSAFEGHELCTPDRYLNRAIVATRDSILKWSFHPNLTGQRKEATLVKDWLWTLE